MLVATGPTSSEYYQVSTVLLQARAVLQTYLRLLGILIWRNRYGTLWSSGLVLLTPRLASASGSRVSWARHT